MTNIARSKETGKIVRAKDVWNNHHGQIPSYISATAFRCLDEDHCGVTLRLINFNNEHAKTIYFRQLSNAKYTRYPTHAEGAHSKDCRMENGTEEERKRFVDRLLAVEGVDKGTRSPRSLPTTIILVDPQKKPIGDNVGQPGRKLPEVPENGEPTSSPESKEKDSESGKSTISSVGSLYSLFVDNPDQYLTSMNWPSFDKDDHPFPLSLVRQLISDSPVQLKSIFSTIPPVPVNIVKAFILLAWINGSDDSEVWTIRSTEDRDVKIRILHKDIAGMINARLIRAAAENKKPIKVVIVGHFYMNRIGKLTWHSRTGILREWLFVPNQ